MQSLRCKTEALLYLEEEGKVWHVVISTGKMVQTDPCCDILTVLA